MKRVVPYWQKEGEWSQQGVFIKRVETKLPIEATEIPRTVLPRFAFLFLLEGEMLAEIDGNPYLCRGGQFLLIPEGVAFSVHHYTDLVGYTGEPPAKLLGVDSILAYFSASYRVRTSFR